MSGVLAPKPIGNVTAYALIDADGAYYSFNDATSVETEKSAHLHKSVWFADSFMLHVVADFSSGRMYVTAVKVIQFEQGSELFDSDSDSNMIDERDRGGRMMDDRESDSLAGGYEEADRIASMLEDQRSEAFDSDAGLSAFQQSFENAIEMGNQGGDSDRSVDSDMSEILTRETPGPPSPIPTSDSRAPIPSAISEEQPDSTQSDSSSHLNDDNDQPMPIAASLDLDLAEMLGYSLEDVILRNGAGGLRVESQMLLNTFGDERALIWIEAAPVEAARLPSGTASHRRGTLLEVRYEMKSGSRTNERALSVHRINRDAHLPDPVHMTVEPDTTTLFSSENETATLKFTGAVQVGECTQSHVLHLSWSEKGRIVYGAPKTVCRPYAVPHKPCLAGHIVEEGRIFLLTFQKNTYNGDRGSSRELMEMSMMDVSLAVKKKKNRAFTDVQIGHLPAGAQGDHRRGRRHRRRPGRPRLPPLR